ncbi:multidrug resistance protein [Chytriomyces sp. MP71]|nr:multidrug resistance protein [Chytriomyces sp. MP71]
MSETKAKWGGWLKADKTVRKVASEDVAIAVDDIGADTGNKKEAKKDEPPKLPFFSLFKYADGFDRFLFVVGVIFSVAAAWVGGWFRSCHEQSPKLLPIQNYRKLKPFIAGCLSPFLFLVFGNLLAAFNLIRYDPDGFTSELHKYVLYFVCLGLGSFTLNYIGTLAWRLTGERQALRIRLQFMESLLKQDISWFDERRVGDLAARLSTDTFIIQSGLSEKIGLALVYISSFLGSFIVAYTQGWKMALVITAAVPALGIVLASTFSLLAKLTSQGQTDYAAAGALASEVLSSIRTVFAFGGQRKEAETYEKLLMESQGIRRKKLLSTGIGFGMVNLMIYAFIALGLWCVLREWLPLLIVSLFSNRYGATLLVTGEYAGQNVLIVFFTLLVGSFSIGNLGPYATAFATAQGAAYSVYDIIDKKGTISVSRDTDINPGRFSREIEFRNVNFHYPTRPDVPVFQNLNLKIPYGKTVALVGSSGSGKSTLMQLLQRFYDPVEGEVLIDGVNARNVGVKALRSQMGVVSQEPVLFRYSVRENIRFGKLDATEGEIEEAARAANAYEFIKALPQGFENDVGERGGLLSGGQKQRVAIARAIIKNPPILLLDEATSALDSQSETLVQEALEKVSVGRTTIVIAHRLSTVKDADLIVVLEKGDVVEMGSHDELMVKKGRYFELVNKQDLKKDENGPILSEPSENEKGSEVTPAKERIQWKYLFRLIGYNSPQWYLLAISGLAATVLGTAFPVYSLFFGKLIAAFFDPNVASLQSTINTWCLVFLMIGVGGFIATFLQIVFIGLYGSKIFVKNQEVGWFDEGKNSSSNLNEVLGKDVESLEALLDQTVTQGWSSIVNALVGTGIGLYYSWKLTLVALALLPFSFLNMQNSAYYDKATFIANEAIYNVRTVVSLGLEDFFIEKYRAELMTPFNISYRLCFVAAFGPAFAQCSQFFTYAVSYYYGGSLVSSGDIDFSAMNIVIQSVFFMALALGQIGALSPNVTKALLAANKVFGLVDRVTLMDRTAGKPVDAGRMTGDVRVTDATFSYPTRPDAQVLKGVTLDVKPGSTIGLVGSSGSGKSTIISLVLRFYDPTTGSLTFGAPTDPVNGVESKLESLRSFMAIVSQEPTLFARTLEENIRYGNESAELQDVIQAAKDANIHDFITTLPDGYKTFAGERGAQLSGGQKQRIAIARALVRNPKLLLLDEATSALDTESESVVQDALHKASVGRTTLVIAHRLSTIQNADCIYVFKEGVVVEQGTHQQLLSMRRNYYELVEQQRLAT